ncbi:transcriptional regulatory [[Actinomadura] parvosata subsp. kistnae]|uniref:hypothetical protein n=1 Tax=[Actinomadura] parvosata TaxID=1955412 RepID=UPI000D2D880C|nr:transcriptional regulatory [Actinomadura parvosata subsp. kistnae]
MVVVEDAHWADEATLDWLVWLGRRIGRLPALLVVTYRDDEVGAEHPIRGALAALPSAIVRRVRLRPLSYGCVTELVRRAGRDPATVHRLTGGNPLLVTELLASEGPAVPATVQDLILDRLCSLPEPARELARLVSVLPTRADAAVVAGAADLVETCVDAGVLVPSGDGVAFRHELLRSAVEESLSPARRAAAHRRVLGVLARTPGVDPGRLVHHALNARDEAAVLRYGQLAGIGAARQGAHREAAAHYRAAVEHAGGLPAERRAELLEAYAEQAYLAGLAEEALRARQAALELREAEGRAGPVGENLRWISRLAWWAGRREQAWEAAARLVTVLEDGDPQLAMAYSNQSQLHMAAHHLDEAVAWGERARELADRLGDVAASVHAEINVSTARLVRGKAGRRRPCAPRTSGPRRPGWPTTRPGRWSCWPRGRSSSPSTASRPRARRGPGLHRRPQPRRLCSVPARRAGRGAGGGLRLGRRAGRRRGVAGPRGEGRGGQVPRAAGQGTDPGGPWRRRGRGPAGGGGRAGRAHRRAAAGGPGDRRPLRAPAVVGRRGGCP